MLAQWMSSPPLIRACFTEAMDHDPLAAVHKTKVQAIRTYAEALFLTPYLGRASLEGVRKNPPLLAPFLHVYPSHTTLCGWKVVWGQSPHA